MDAYQVARNYCTDFPDAECNTKTLPEFAKAKYDECCEELFDGIVSETLNRTYSRSILSKCISARASLDSTFSASTDANTVLCDMLHSEFLNELEDKDNRERTEAMWNMTLVFCPRESRPNRLSEYFVKHVFDSFSSLSSSDDQEDERDNFLELLEFWRSFGVRPEHECYKTITDMASLKEYINNYQNFIRAYPPFKEAFEPYITKLNSKACLTSDDLKPLRDALPNVKSCVTSIDLPSLAEKDQITAYRILRKAMKNNKGDLADRVLFEYYDDIIRYSMLGNSDFEAEKDKAREAYLILRTNFEGITKECYGDFATLDETCDFMLADNIYTRFKSTSRCNGPAEMVQFREVFRMDKLHIFQFPKDVREMMLLVNDKNDVVFGKPFFNSLDYESNVTGSLRPFVAKFAEYALARKEYISKDFKDPNESKAQHDHLRELLNETKAFDREPDEFERIYALPPIAIPGQLPFICSNADKMFMNRFGKESMFGDAYDVAAEACRSFDNYFRVGIDGSNVSYTKFYEGELGESV